MYKQTSTELYRSVVDSLQRELAALVLDYEKLSIQRHYYWPGIQMIRMVSTEVQLFSIIMKL